MQLSALKDLAADYLQFCDDVATSYQIQNPHRATALTNLQVVNTVNFFEKLVPFTGSLVVICDHVEIDERTEAHKTVIVGAIAGYGISTLDDRYTWLEIRPLKGFCNRTGTLEYAPGVSSYVLVRDGFCGGRHDEITGPSLTKINNHESIYQHVDVLECVVIPARVHLPFQNQPASDERGRPVAASSSQQPLQ